VTERAVVDLQRGRGRWAREGYDIGRTSATMGLNRDIIIIDMIMKVEWW